MQPVAEPAHNCESVAVAQLEQDRGQGWHLTSTDLQVSRESDFNFHYHINVVQPLNLVECIETNKCDHGHGHGHGINF